MRFPDILSTWIVHEVNHIGTQSNTCQMIELQGDGTHILYLVDNKLAEIFWYIPPLKKELPPFSYDIQSQEIQKLEDLFAFCGNTRKTFLNNHALLIEGYNCLKTSRRSSAGTKKGKIHSKDRRFETSQLQIYFQPLEDYIVEGHHFINRTKVRFKVNHCYHDSTMNKKNTTQWVVCVKKWLWVDLNRHTTLWTCSNQLAYKAVGRQYINLQQNASIGCSKNEPLITTKKNVIPMSVFLQDVILDDASTTPQITLMKKK